MTLKFLRYLVPALLLAAAAAQAAQPTPMATQGKRM
jgi:hypothetical protein